MRSNLLSLQNTVKLLDRTQERLSTGKKVNTAIDNPVSFFAAQSLNSRASVIDSLKDAMGQAVQTVKAADKGITAITAMIEQAKGIAQEALSVEMSTTPASTTGTATIGESGGTYTATFEVGGTIYTGTSTSDAEGAYTALQSELQDNVPGVATGGATVDTTSGDVTIKYEPVANPEFTALMDRYNELRNQLDTIALDSGYKGKNLLNSAVMTVKFEGSHTLEVQGFDASTTGLGIGAATWTTEAAIDASIVELDNAAVTLRSEASKLSGNLSIITVRQDFSDNMINTLTEGADKLTLADTNEEGANMLMLQTRQSLSTTALSLSAQAAQSVLRLFG
jgi:flagellin-like hook-associated protein FlgL